MLKYLLVSQRFPEKPEGQAQFITPPTTLQLPPFWQITGGGSTEPDTKNLE